MAERLVVVGGNAAGMSAASQARRMRSAEDLEILALEGSSFVSYAACGEPYHVAGYVDPLERLVARWPDQFADMGIEVRTRHHVREIDLDRRVVTGVDVDTGMMFEEGFDQLMVSTGTVPFRPPIDGIDLPGVYGLHTLDDAALLRRVADGSPGRVVVVGGGYIGLEVAEAFLHRRWEVTVVESEASVLARTLDADMGDRVIGAMRRMGADVRSETMVRCIQGPDRARAVGCDDDAIPADVVVLGLGSRPQVELAAGAGIALGPTGAVAVDDHQRTPTDGVWSAGDCAETRHRITGRPANFHLGTVANKTGRVAGVNLGGGDASFPGVLGTAITRICELEVSSTGLRVSDAEVAGIDAVAATVEGTTAAGYWPEARPMAIRVVAERSTGRLLGSQIVGGPGAGKRIDVFATAIWNEVSAEELAWTDLAYAPPFSGVWDLIHIAARKAAEAAGV
ncbi:MAG: FAD-dependent oxidoreductase [Acidimicrobiia bacterium]|jgi:NADPH-dependent 2,4-dienoyl-CoA reductase/sulfur reductase-like enzyme